MHYACDVVPLGSEKRGAASAAHGRRQAVSLRRGLLPGDGRFFSRETRTRALEARWLGAPCADEVGWS